MVEISWEQSVAILTMKGATPWNVMDRAMLEQLGAALPEVVAQGARAIVLTGAGRVFSAGGDVHAFNALAQEGADALSSGIGMLMEEFGNPIARFIAGSPVPVISAVNGPCAGGAMGYALAADIVLCARSAYFLVAQVAQLGVVPDLGINWVIARSLGRPRALGMALLGDRIGGEQAEQWGLVWRCVDDTELLPQALAFAHKLAALPKDAIAECRRLVDDAAHMSIKESLAAEREVQRGLVRSSFFREACAKFAAK
ncbi:1,2-epoxyphenylacetyl-CoA isomerase [Paraburkholderia kirstenboschensis]|uniref:enoyl-CoA hydratase-related protein n=1 Tax=Paraburkholderia kirstenboschensis TaxID=1245436 RepID=UPI000A9D01DB|nr:enoyl-CoA hydratase-related protein [Paraburkholderia kirstenboschensis]CAD6551118.1 1,2-epoxyphenylacetyl-CoA isomerase [Paraburkholderia kirstenboschensis]